MCWPAQRPSGNSERVTHQDDPERIDPASEELETIWHAQGAVMELLGIDARTAGQCRHLLADRHEQTMLDTARGIVGSRSLPG